MKKVLFTIVVLIGVSFLGCENPIGNGEVEAISGGFRVRFELQSGLSNRNQSVFRSNDTIRFQSFFINIRNKRSVFYTGPLFDININQSEKKVIGQWDGYLFQRPIFEIKIDENDTLRNNWSVAANRLKPGNYKAELLTNIYEENRYVYDENGKRFKLVLDIEIVP
ncbi:MAG: hypothetical protein SFU91_15210 [Chloroherpetonaceae bacterium]|nr:hypothetical protein [Chloroherpetonaceae bacterium]